MNDQDLRDLFKNMKHGEPTPLEIARWKKTVRAYLPKNRGEWTRLIAACLIGVVIGAAAFRGKNHSADQENNADDATIERIYINL